MRRRSALAVVVGASIVLASCVSFGAPVPVRASADQAARSGKPAFAHIVGTDVVVLTSGGAGGDALELLTRCGDGCLQRIETVELPDRGVDLAVADFDHDGIDDVVISGQTAVRVFFGRAATSHHAAGLDPSSIAVISGLSYPSVIAGDFNGDGNTDIGAWGRTDPQLYTTPAYVVANGDGSGGFSPPTTVASFMLPKFAAPAALGIGDINGDGRPEALVGIVDAGTPQLLLFAYSDTGLVAQYDLAANTDFFTATGDLDGDGNADVIVTGTDTDTISWWNGLGNGQFRTINGTSRIDHDAGPSPTSFALGDVAGTALADAVVANSDQPYAQLSVLTNNSR